MTVQQINSKLNIKEIFIIKIGGAGDKSPLTKYNEGTKRNALLIGVVVNLSY